LIFPVSYSLAGDNDEVGVAVGGNGAEGEARCTDIMEIIRPDDLEDIADLVGKR